MNGSPSTKPFPWTVGNPLHPLILFEMSNSVSFIKMSWLTLAMYSLLVDTSLQRNTFPKQPCVSYKRILYLPSRVSILNFITCAFLCWSWRFYLESLLDLFWWITFDSSAPPGCLTSFGWIIFISSSLSLIWLTEDIILLMSIFNLCCLWWVIIFNNLS